MTPVLDPPDDLLAKLRRSAFRPSRTRGQHFLNDSSIARRIVEAAGVRRHTAVLEIGPGAGALTRHLVGRAGRITAVEIDARLARALEEAYGQYGHLTILNRDVLDLHLPDMMASSGALDFVIVANLPYGITGPVLDRLIACRDKIRHAVLMVQREVGERLTAVPGTKAYGAITAILAYHYRVESLFRVGGDRFVPRPAVDSLVLRMTPHQRPPVAVRDPALLAVVIRAAFQHRRKMLRHAVSRLAGGSADLVSERTGIDLKRRGETLDLAEFSALANALAEYEDGREDRP